MVYACTTIDMYGTLFFLVYVKRPILFCCALYRVKKHGSAKSINLGFRVYMYHDRRHLLKKIRIVAVRNDVIWGQFVKKQKSGISADKFHITV